MLINGYDLVKPHFSPAFFKGGPGGFFQFLPAFLAWLAGLGLAGWFNLSSAPAQEAPAQESPAADLARRLGCFACHHPGPGHRAAPLDHVGARLSQQQLQIVLTQPRQLHPSARMPSYAYLPADERQALPDFLEHFK